MSKDDFEYCQLTEFAKRVERHHTTINNWFNQLEAERIHYVSRTTTGKERVFDKQDYEIARFIINKRDDNWSMASIFELLPTEPTIQLRPFPLDFEDEDSSSPIALADQMRLRFSEDIKAILDHSLSEFKNDMIKQQQLALPDPIQQREREVNMRLTERRIESQLKKQAIDAWNRLPESERTRKRGLFGREEDYIKREDFIRDYVSEHEAEAFRREFGL